MAKKKKLIIRASQTINKRKLTLNPFSTSGGRKTVNSGRIIIRRRKS